MTYTKLKGAISLASNTPGVPTGYGVQGQMLVERMKRLGLDVAALSNYGLEGRMDTLETEHGQVPHYPRGVTLYSGDVMKLYHEDFLAGRDIPNFILTLYDTWVYLERKDLDDLDIVSWVPIDHLTIPAKVELWCKKENVTPIAMSEFGLKQLKAQGIDAHYIPHAVDTSLYKPTHEIDGQPIRDYYGLKDDDFLVGMVAANKANGQIHRKAFAENILAFSLFKKNHPNAYLYIHSDPSKVYGGFGLLNLIQAVGLDKDSVLFPDPHKYRMGYSDKEMAALYTGMDILLHTSYGEGFGVPAIEAQACGTPTISSSWTASLELAGPDSYLVEGQPFWDEAQLSWFQIPNVNSITAALEKAYERGRQEFPETVDFASAYDVEAVWNAYWLPFLKEKLK